MGLGGVRGPRTRKLPACTCKCDKVVLRLQSACMTGHEQPPSHCCVRPQSNSAAAAMAVRTCCWPSLPVHCLVCVVILCKHTPA